MVFQFLRLEMLKLSRSSSFGRSLAVALFLGLVALLLLSYIFLLGISLPYLIENFFEGEEAVNVLNRYLIYFFLFEIIYRYFIQSLPVLDLENWLHHPVNKGFIINFLLVKSFISPLNIVAILLFLPITVMNITPSYGAGQAFQWFGFLLMLSWALHYLVLWFKQSYDDSIWSIVMLAGVMVLSSGANYMGWFDIGQVMAPVFEFALVNFLPVAIGVLIFIAAYLVAYKFYRKNTYVEDLTSEEQVKFGNQSIGFFNRFGMAGEYANLEWKLIIRHKKSRTYLNLAGFFLLYGLIFYTNDAGYVPGETFPYLWVFVGSFITGIFMLQYGQLFLSWNSANFDFFLSRKNGVKELVQGKYLLFASICSLCLLLSVPYVYFGWDILLIHLVMFVFNIGVIMHLVIWLSLYKPKPMDLNKGAMFNYEGVGMAQFLMIIPMMVAPYIFFLPIAALWGPYVGLAVLGVIGIAGMLAFNKMAAISVQRIISNKYEISSSFRQEL
ncbi:hypothetical protein KIH41_11145 [Litoribacter ruber]|uniref:DUF5687 family protein n=1 Tax=Litoribacter ruber TaxID=702568 RepID=UPI001BDA5167|nr:DUF5687 family protein [Litoribacter ruber]MBT0811833.1 hypothetical protein [Litoribacter ruber]